MSAFARSCAQGGRRHGARHARVRARAHASGGRFVACVARRSSCVASHGRRGRRVVWRRRASRVAGRVGRAGGVSGRRVGALASGMSRAFRVVASRASRSRACASRCVTLARASRYALTSRAYVTSRALTHRALCASRRLHALRIARRAFTRLRSLRSRVSRTRLPRVVARTARVTFRAFRVSARVVVSSRLSRRLLRYI